MRFALGKIVAAAAALFASTSIAQRPLENLGRGVVAIRSGGSEAFISWRLLGLDPSGIGFNIYRSVDGGNAEQLNADVLTGGTNFVDDSADSASDYTYHVRTVIDGTEGEPSGEYTLAADAAEEPVVRIPINSGAAIKFIWVGDLDGDGEFDFVLDRQSSPQSIEAYTSRGEQLWSVNLGPNSENQNNIEPGSSTVDVGHWDGVTVFDLDGDGYAEVAIRIANGVQFADGETFSEGADDNEQFIAVLDGQTGSLRASYKLPTTYISAGPLGARLGVGFLDGERAHIVAYMKNREDDGSFNLIIAAYTFDGSSLSEAWVWQRDSQDAADGHNTRIIDVDGDGTDEVAEIGFVLNGDGSLRYSLASQGIQHGDRFHIAKMDPGRDGLQGYGVQQDNEDLIYEYYYDATDGSILWKHFGDAVGDVGRGMAGDIDPNYPGMEVWSFSGVFNAAGDELTSGDPANHPWPHLGLYWDGDELMELYNDGKIEEWDYEANGVVRLLTAWNFGANNDNPNPPLIADIFGDWREEVVMGNGGNWDELVIFTTNIPSDIRLYTLPHNPAYRNSMTLKGYPQSHHVDYFIGQDMETPAQPSIRYAGA